MHKKVNGSQPISFAAFITKCITESSYITLKTANNTMSQFEISPERQWGNMVDKEEFENKFGGFDNPDFTNRSEKKDGQHQSIHEAQMDYLERQVAAPSEDYQREIYYLSKQLEIMKNRLQKSSLLLNQEKETRAAADHYAGVYWDQIQDLQKALDEERQLRLAGERELTEVTVSKIDTLTQTENFDCERVSEQKEYVDPGRSSEQVELSEPEGVSEVVRNNETKWTSKPEENSDQETEENLEEKVPEITYPHPEEDDMIISQTDVYYDVQEEEDEAFDSDSYMEEQENISLWRRFKKFMTPKFRRQYKPKKKKKVCNEMKKIRI